MDALLTLYAVRWARRLWPGPRAAALPVLMYHTVSDEPAVGGHPYYHTHTSPARFREQVRYLAQQGYEAPCLRDAVSRMRTGSGGLEKTVVFTFDDGYADFLSDAWPVLRDAGFRATVFLPTAYVRSSRGTFANRPCLTVAEVCSLAGEGVEFGSHTVTHPRLEALPWPELEREVRESRTQIASWVGRAAGFSFPFAFPDAAAGFKRRFRASLQDAGYEYGATTVLGRCAPQDDPFLLKRIPVNDRDGAALFSAKLRGDYDWVRGVQAAVKRLKGIRGRNA